MTDAEIKADRAILVAKARGVMAEAQVTGNPFLVLVSRQLITAMLAPYNMAAADNGREPIRPEEWA